MNNSGQVSYIDMVMTTKEYKHFEQTVLKIWFVNNNKNIHEPLVFT